MTKAELLDLVYETAKEVYEKNEDLLQNPRVPNAVIETAAEIGSLITLSVLEKLNVISLDESDSPQHPGDSDSDS